MLSAEQYNVTQKEGPTVVFDNDIQVGLNPIKASEILRKKINDWKNRESKQKKQDEQDEQEISQAVFL
jgi:hypothetical protein